MPCAWDRSAADARTAAPMTIDGGATYAMLGFAPYERQQYYLEA
jgi:hypothetical protein